MSLSWPRFPALVEHWPEQFALRGHSASIRLIPSDAQTEFPIEHQYFRYECQCGKVYDFILFSQIPYLHLEHQDRLFRKLDFNPTPWEEGVPL